MNKIENNREYLQPYKVIWKYKNDNEYTQYHTYIFIGDLHAELDNIFKKMQNTNFFDTLIQLSNNDIKKLENTYDEFWYRYFFNMYHLAFMITQINSTKTLSDDIKAKLGQEWFDKHISSFIKSDAINKKILYSYGSKISKENVIVKKGKVSDQFNNEENDETDYRMTKTTNIKSLLLKQKGGNMQQFSLENVNLKPNDLLKSINKRANLKSNDKEFIEAKKDILIEESNSSNEELISNAPDDIESIVNQDIDVFDNNHSNLDDSYNENTESVLAGGSSRNKYYDWNSNEYVYLNPIRFKSYKNKIPKGERLRYDQIPPNADIDYYPDEGRLNKPNNVVKNQFGGDDDIDYDDVISEDDDNDQEQNDQEQNENEDLGFDDGLEYDENQQENEEDYEDLEKLYQQDEIDTDATQVSSMIKKILDDDSIYKKIDKHMVEFNQDNDKSNTIEKLKDVYVKYYVKSQYIFGDDSIKDVKSKICCSIKNNSKFGKMTYLVPSRQYLWSEYVYKDNIEKVMIGQKWLRRNELLEIDCEPNTKIKVYEQLKENLGLLRQNMKKFGNKIRREDDEGLILFDYSDYVTNNEIYMIDVYNDLGKGYTADIETIKNLKELYFRIYYPKLRDDDIRMIIDYLNGNTKAEDAKVNLIYDTLQNDQIIINEIMHIVEDVKNTTKDYTKIFKENYITQSVIHVNMRILNKNQKLDLYRIFNEFITTKDYPYIQYQTIEKGTVYKYDENEIYDYVKDKDNLEVLYKWFENSPYGINFKVRVKDKFKNGTQKEKFMSISLNENGRIEYKTQWQETYEATLDDIRKTYIHVQKLIEKINAESKKNKNKIIVPLDEEFKYAFINTIQKFELPEKYTINHNDLSEFSRFFFPYVSLVIEPRKREGKISKSEEVKSKFGTYLRYKRVSNYENTTRIEQRVVFFMRNYTFHDNQLASELAKQFNITDEKALESIQKTRLKYPNMKPARTVLKKMENIPKYKPPGIGIDIQGKQRDKYKVRISGARNKEQLNRIITFMNILIQLYIETYLLKIKDRQIIKEKLKKLTNIAKRRSKVDVLVDHTKEAKTIKQMAQVDKQRLGFKPEKGQNQWSRSCQNSGNDKKRRPQQYNPTNMNELIRKGYVYNKKTDLYEKKFPIGKGAKKKDVLLKTIKMPEFDESGEKTGNQIHYACEPEENGTHMYVGFLTRSANPFGHCMPCCFKKDPAISNNKSKREFFKGCLETGLENTNNVDETEPKNVNEKLYILQDTNKIQEGRFAFLPKYLDRYFNEMLDKNKKIKSHYLEHTTNGYFFKYGSKQTEYQFLNAIASIFDSDVEKIRSALITSMENDKSDQIFTSLNNGDIRTQFGTRAEFIKYIKTSIYLDYVLMKDLICIPHVLSKFGINLIIFHKKDVKIKQTLEKDKLIEDFFIECTDKEGHFTIKEPDYRTIFLIRDNKNYYPIVLVKKEDKNVKSVQLEKIFTYDPKDSTNIVNHVLEFFERNCSGDNNFEIRTGENAKKTTYLLKELGKDYSPRYQVIDSRNKCKYLITSKGNIIPVQPSGGPWNVQIIKNFDKYIMSLDDTLKYLNEIYLKSNKKINVKPYGVYYESKKNDIIKINSILTETKEIIPIIVETVDLTKIKNMKLIYEKKPLTDTIDNEIAKGNKNIKIDARITQVNENIFIEESYQLFRLEFSNYINKIENEYYKGRFEKLMNNTNLDKVSKINKIRLLLYRIINKSMTEKYIESMNMQNDEDAKEKEIDNQTGGKLNKLIQKISKLPNVSNYQLNNDRYLCESYANKDQCNDNIHCKWNGTDCYLGLTENMIAEFINRISEELAQNDLKAFELMRYGDYFISDIVDRNNYTYLKGQKIIKSSSSNVKKILSELFGQDNIPEIGKRNVKTYENIDTNYLEMNDKHQLIDMGDSFIQPIISNNITVLRAYVNGYHWLKNSFYDINARNLGYYSQLQSNLANTFKAFIIDWLNDLNKRTDTEGTLIKESIINTMSSGKLSKNPINEFIYKLSNDTMTYSNGLTELLILSQINDIPIIIKNNDKIIYVIDNGKIHKKNDKIDLKKSIVLQYEYIGNMSVPDNINVVYHK